jgi:sugar phosphate permease
MPDSKKPRIFYGWWIVVSCFINGILLGGFITMGFTAFIDPIANDLHWNYTQISFAASLRGVEVALFSPFIGYIVDRWGPRKMLLGGTVLTGLSLIFLSSIHSLGMFYLGFIIMALGLSGNSPPVVMTTMANWFRKRLGLASGIIGSGFAVGGLLVPIVVRMIDTLDWRTALLIMGIITIAVGIPTSLVLRHKPEQYGYLPDGESTYTSIDKKEPAKVREPENDTSTRQALKDRAFWYITLSMTFQIIAVTTVVVHVMPSLTSVEISRTTASIVTTAVPLLSIIGRLSSGWLADKYNVKWVSTGFFICLMIGLGFMSFVSNLAVWMVIPFAFFFGVGWGGNNTIRVNLTNRYFGRTNFGTIFGIISGVNALGGLIGPIFAGWIFDTWGSYQTAWITLTILVLISIFFIIMLPPKTAPSTATEKLETEAAQIQR